jgi:opacity protein-like surface antigen
MTMKILMIALVAVALAAPAQAQQSYRVFKEWYGWFHFGYMMPQGDYGDVTDSDWTIGGGATYMPDSLPIGIDIGLDYHENDIKREIVSGLQADNGYVDVWSLSLGARWQSDTRGSIDFYAKGGLSYNWMEATISDSAWVPGWICDPWYWWYCRPGWVPGEIINARHSENSWGYYIGFGLDFETSPTTSVYLEAEYRVIDTEIKTTYIPLVIGFRF